jgi:hypothetical protein
VPGVVLNPLIWIQKIPLLSTSLRSFFTSVFGRAQEEEQRKSEAEESWEFIGVALL